MLPKATYTEDRRFSQKNIKLYAVYESDTFTVKTCARMIGTVYKTLQHLSSATYATVCKMHQILYG